MLIRLYTLLSQYFKWGVPLWCLILISILIQSILAAIHQKSRPSRQSMVVRRGAFGRLAPKINEASGVCPSLSQPHHYWTHNDSLDQARLFLFKGGGQIVSEVVLPHQTNIDWEACASSSWDRIDGDHMVYVADTGNNFHWRRDQKIYAFKESKDESSRLSLLKEYPIRFPNDQQLPLNYWSQEGRCRDLESLFWRKHELFVISKCTIGGPTTLWRIPREHSTVQKALVLQAVQKLEIEGDPHPLRERVTGASYSASHELLVVLTYRSLWFFSVNGTPQLPHFKYYSKCLLNQGGRIVRQAEAVTWRDLSIHDSPGTHLSVLVLTESRDAYTYLVDLQTRSCQ